MSFDFRVAREDQAYGRNFDWMIVTIGEMMEVAGHVM